ncbi:Hypothetical protein EPM1_3729 [Stenotrophomonas maltophilia EPM1]|nr:Hypothetical protein EPM1_3729 [Stenotrophomonas maltophilia EPM1]KMU66083.1 hypothetical protein STRNTR1_1580 [Stenotrophomonas maltophilia]
MPGLIHVEVTVRPMRDRVGLAGLVEGPIGHFSRPCWQ